MKKSFTLIELLVVIVVIGVLAAMILPALSKAKEYGRRAKCKANLKQLHMAAMSYFYEHEQLPYVESSESNTSKYGPVPWHQEHWGWLDWLNYNPGSGGDPPPWWGDDGRTGITNGTLWQYTGESLKMYLCPKFALSDVCGSEDPEGNKFTSANPVLRSYAMNSQAGGIEMHSLRDASRRVLFADISETNMLGSVDICVQGMKDNNAAAWDGSLNGTNRMDAGGNIPPMECIGAFHNGRGNAVFVDGHVEVLLWSDTTNACSGNW